MHIKAQSDMTVWALPVQPAYKGQYVGQTMSLKGAIVEKRRFIPESAPHTELNHNSYDRKVSGARPGVKPVVKTVLADTSVIKARGAFRDSRTPSDGGMFLASTYLKQEYTVIIWNGSVWVTKAHWDSVFKPSLEPRESRNPHIPHTTEDNTPKTADKAISNSNWLGKRR